MNRKVDKYLEDGCGRCEFYRTPKCKVKTWQAELQALRAVLLDCGLTEEVKWSQPCYTYDGNNIVILSALKGHATLGFFKGALLKDTQRILSKPGDSSQAARQLTFTDVSKIDDMVSVIQAYVAEAVEVEKAGLKVTFKNNPEPIPEELQNTFDNDPEFETAFEALTPGRQRGYIITFSQPKQSKTRYARIEKYRQQILDGIGLNDKYKSMKK